MALLLQDFTCLLVRFKAKTLHSREVGRGQYISATNDRVSGSCPRPCQSPAGLRIGLMLVQGNYVHQLATALRADLQEDVRNVKLHGALGDAEFTGDGPGGAR